MPCLELYYIPQSPFAHKLLFALQEFDLLPLISLHAVSDPPPAELVEEKDLYPLSAFVPSLVTPQGTLFDSSVILQYLDTVAQDSHRGGGDAGKGKGKEGRLFPPAESGERWSALTYEALCKGVMGTAMMVQQQRSRGSSGPGLLAQEVKVKAGLARLGGYALPAVPGEGGRMDVRGVSLGSLLGYLEGLEWARGWRGWEGGQRLGGWFERVRERLPRFEEL